MPGLGKGAYPGVILRAEPGRPYEQTAYICFPFRCQGHQFWQFHSSPVGDVIKPLSSLPARSTFAGHAAQCQISLQACMACYMVGGVA